MRPRPVRETIIERATELARKMVCEWGMSEKLGPLAFGRKKSRSFLGRELLSIGTTVRRQRGLLTRRLRVWCQMPTKGRKRSCEDNMDALHALAQALLERETLAQNDIDAIIAGNAPAPLA